MYMHGGVAVILGRMLSRYFCVILLINATTFSQTSNDDSRQYNFQDCWKKTIRNASEVVIPEDTKIGTTVLKLPTDEYSIPGAIIQDGNTDNRFSLYAVSELRLLGLLDYSIHKEYNLTLLWYKPHGDDMRCIKHRLKVRVEDKDDWPPYFNESCYIPPRADSISNDVSVSTFPLSILINELRYPSIATQGHDIDNVWMDVRYRDCSCIVYIAVGFTSHYVPVKYVNKSNMNFTCFGGKMSDIDVSLYRDREDFPKNTVINYDMFQGKFYDHPLLEVRMLKGNLATLLQNQGVDISCSGTWTSTGAILPIGASLQVEAIGCPKGKYGFRCENDCYCENGGTCHTFTGACLCPIDWKGVACDIPKRRFIKFERKHYATYINHYVTVLCHFYHFTTYASRVWFKDGLTNITGSHPVLHKWGDNILFSKLEIKSVQDYYGGTYSIVVEDEFGEIFNDSTVLEVLGCQTNFYGEKCDQVCNCPNSENCDRFSGCQCLPGWTGERCDEVCGQGTYGAGCAFNCSCHNNATCDPVTGTCHCQNLTCGQYCEQLCYCPMGDYFMCDNDIGCMCVTSDMSKEVTRSSHPPSRSLYAMSFTVVCIILICASILVIYRKCRRRPGQEIIGNEFDAVVQDYITELKPWLIKPGKVTVFHEKGLLGQGSFAQVLSARLKTSKMTRDVAVKRITQSLYNQINYINFCEEILRLSTLHDHPNVIGFHGVVLNGDQKYIVMEYASRGDMFAYIKNLSFGNMSAKEEGILVKLARDVTVALQFLAEKKIVHRDLATRNVLITDHFVGKLADFGLSRELEGEEYFKSPWSERQGPLPLKWMPPEFIRRGIFQIKSDIWSFGVFMWEIATLGDSPFAGIQGTDFIRRCALGERLERPNYSSDKWFAVMRKCWHGPVQLRPSAKELTEELNAIMACDEKIYLRGFQTKCAVNTLFQGGYPEKAMLVHEPLLPGLAQDLRKPTDAVQNQPFQV